MVLQQCSRGYAVLFLLLVLVMVLTNYLQQAHSPKIAVYMSQSQMAQSPMPQSHMSQTQMSQTQMPQTQLSQTQMQQSTEAAPMSQGGVCSVEAGFTPDWTARSSCGCRLHHTYPGLSFKCRPPINITEATPLVDARQLYYRHAQRIHVICKKRTKYGRRKYGSWNVCTAGPFAIKEPCLIYSVGIGTSWGFDDHISSQEKCQVYAFDPTINLADHKHSDLVWFYDRGLSNKTEVNEKGWKMNTFRDLLTEFGHLNKTIDFFKFDVDFMEWAVLENMLHDGILRNVKQIGFEAHAWGDTTKDYLYFTRLLQGLENLGFQKWLNIKIGVRCARKKDNKYYCPQADMVFINTNFLK